MNALRIGTGLELKKLLTKKKYFVITILGVLVCVMRLGGGLLLTRLSHGVIAVKSNLALEMLPFATDILVPLIVFMAVTDLFACEIQDDTMKASLMLPLTRFKVMLSKTLAAFFTGCIVMLVMMIVCFIIQLIGGMGMQRMPAQVMAYVLDMLPIIGIAALAVLINLIAKGPTLSMLLCIAVYVFFKYLNLYVSPVGQMVFTAYSQWHRLWIGSLLPMSAMLPKLGIILGSVLILFTLSYIIMDKKDF